MSAPLLELAGVSRTYPVRSGLFGPLRHVQAVRDVHLAIAPGETVGLVGESGCGKSTCARMACALENPDAGEVRFEGSPLSSPVPHNFRRSVQMVFQDPFGSLNPRMHVGTSVAEPLHALGIGTAAERARRVADLLQRCGLSPDAATRYPHQFSGGQRQRIAIARALAPSPRLLVCDEAVSALDVSIQAQIINLLADLQAELGLAYLFISHDLSVVRHVSRRVTVMYLGHIVEEGPTKALFAQPLHPYTETLLAAVPVPDPTATPHTAPSGGEPPSPLDPPQGCPFHPRCPKRFAPCDHEMPAMRTHGDGQRVACHLY